VSRSDNLAFIIISRAFLALLGAACGWFTAVLYFAGKKQNILVLWLVFFGGIGLLLTRIIRGDFDEPDFVLGMIIVFVLLTFVEGLKRFLLSY
jgi:hypothetical protein